MLHSRLVMLVIVSALSASTALASEARAPGGRPAREYFLGGGLTFMTTPPVDNREYGPGVHFMGYYGGRYLAGVLQVTIARAESESYALTYGGYSLGARYRLFDALATPFAGAGLTAASSGFYASGHDSEGGLGLAPYAELGAEVFRFSTIRGALSLRVDQPLFESLRDTNRRSDSEGRPVYDTVVTSFTPISLHMSVGWGFGEGDGPRP